MLQHKNRKYNTENEMNPHPLSSTEQQNDFNKKLSTLAFYYNYYTIYLRFVICVYMYTENDTILRCVFVLLLFYLCVLVLIFVVFQM